MSKLDYYMPVHFYSGESTVEKHADLFSGFGSRCLLLTGKSSAVRSGALQDVLEVLNRFGIPYKVFDRVSQNPPVASCQQAGFEAHAFGADFIIGIGGGSALDAAKAASVFAANPELDEDLFYQKRWSNAPLPIVLVGTTSGTGSEVTKVSVLTDSKGRKHSIHDDRLFARAAFGDPRYTMALPSAITCSTGIDVLSHCAESYFNRKADEISRAFAVRGIRLLYAPLLAAAKNETLSLEQRAQLYEASILGGLAICGTGTCFPHNLGYYLTETYGIPHGYASAVFLPAMFELMQEKASAYSDLFFTELGIPLEQILHLISECLPALDVRMTEEELLSVLPRWENNNSVRNTYCDVSLSEIQKIYKKLFIKEKKGD